MIGLDAWARHAIGEFITKTGTVSYNPISRPTGDFTALLFKTRADYAQEDDMKDFAAFSSSAADSVGSGTLNNVLTIDTTISNAYGVASLAGNTITILKKGRYRLEALISYYPDTDDLNGSMLARTTGLTGGINFYETRNYDVAWAMNYDQVLMVIPVAIVANNSTDTIQIKFNNALGDVENVQVLRVLIQALEYL